MTSEKRRWTLHSDPLAAEPVRYHIEVCPVSELEAADKQNAAMREVVEAAKRLLKDVEPSDYILACVVALRAALDALARVEEKP